jgi:hypothetical protein
MSSTPIVLVLFTLLLSCGTILLGGQLMKRGFWPKRRGNEPQCCGCGYSLIGLASQKCPECGAVLSPQHVLHGRRQRKMGPGLTGVAMVLFGIAVLSPAMLGGISRIEWYHFKPAFLVMRDLRSSVPTMANQAIIELDRRDQTGGLSPGYQHQLLQMALVQQATSKGTNGEWQISGSMPGMTFTNKPATIDVILHSSEKAARQTVDLTEIWDGEIIYPNIPLGVDSSH